MAPKKKKDPKLTRAGVAAYNKPKRTPNHPKKSHVVVAREGGKTKLIRFGQQGVSTAGKKTDKKRRRLDKSSRHWPSTSSKRERRDSSLVARGIKTSVRHCARAGRPGYGALQEFTKHKRLSRSGYGYAFACNVYG